jgi:hypothetical protein
MNLDEKRNRRRKIVVGSMLAGNAYMTTTLAVAATQGALGSMGTFPIALLVAWNAVFWAGAAYFVNRRMRRQAK